MKFIFLNGDRAGDKVELTPPFVTIGREADNSLQVLVQGISRYHARVDFRDGTWWFCDLSSTNGTKINENLITEATRLSSGDVIKMGQLQLRVMDDGVNAEVPQGVVFRPPQNLEQTVVQPATHEALPVADDIFSKDKEVKRKGGGSGEKKNSRFSSLLFYVLVIGAAVVAVSLFIILANPENKTLPFVPPDTDAPNSLLLVYDKQIIESNNIFRFNLTIENNMAKVTLDDLKYGRRFQENPPVSPEALKRLEDAVRATGFMGLTQEETIRSAGGPNEARSIVLGYENKLNKITIRSTYAPTSFEGVEKAMNDFLGEIGIGVLINLPPDQMRAEALKSFAKANTLFDNMKARPENVREAILRYKITRDLLAQFEPKPEEWDIARRRVDEAEAFVTERVKQAEFDIEMLVRRGQYDEAIAICLELMKMLAPDDERYIKTQKVKIQLEQLRAKGNK